MSGTVFCASVTVVTVKSQEIICPVTVSKLLLMRLSTTGISSNSKKYKKLYNQTAWMIKYKKFGFLLSLLLLLLLDYSALLKAPIRTRKAVICLRKAALTPARCLRASCTVLRATLPDSEPQQHGVLTTPCRTLVAPLPDSEPNFILYFTTEIA